MRGLHEVNNDIIQTMTQTLALERQRVESGLLSAYTQKISDLQEECKQLIWLSKKRVLDYDADLIASSSVLPDIATINTTSDNSEIELRC